MNRVAVTGIGVISALGHDPAAMRAALKSGRSAIGPLTILPTDKLLVKIGAEVPGFDPKAHFPEKRLSLLDRCSQRALVAARQAVVAAQANVDRWQAFDQSIHSLVDASLRPGADASRADAQLAQAKIRLYQIQQAEQAGRATLASLMGTAGTEIKLDASGLLDLPPAESLPDLALAENPLARDQMATVRQIQAQEKTLSRSDYPRIFLQGNVFARGSELPNNGTIIGNWNGLAPARGNWVAGLTITFPNVFDFKALGAQKQVAKANELSQKALYDKTIQDLTGQVQTALTQLKSAQLVAQQTPIELAAARASEAQSRARYNASLATLVEVSDAEGLLAQAEIDDAIARLNVWRGLFAVADAQGNLQNFLQVLHGAKAGGH